MKKIEIFTERKKSVVSQKENMEELLVIKNFPVFFGCTDEPIDKDLCLDMIWDIDCETGIVQLRNLVPLEVLYMSQHVDATGLTWEKYNTEFSEYIIKNKIGDIVEIGGGSGKIADKILNKLSDTKYTIIEPNPLVESLGNLQVIKSFFSEDVINRIDGEKTIVFSQLFEHIYQPEEFLITINNSMSLEDKLIFGYPNLEFWFKNKFTNSINFEHTLLMTDYYVDYFLKKTGFKILEKIEYENHSHFYTVKKISNPLNDLPIVNKYKYYKGLFEDFVNYHKTIVRQINDIITTNSDSDIFLFGGHIFSQYLIMFGLNCEKIKFILDNSTLKQGRRLYGTNLLVKSPKILKDYKEPLVILKAALYDQEIKEDIINNINSNVIFI